MYSIMSSANSKSFTSSCPIWIPFISFSSVIAVARRPRTMLNNSNKIIIKVETLVLFLILGGILSIFHHWQKRLLKAYHIWPLLYWGRFLLHLFCGRVLIMNGCWILSKAFSISIIIWPLSFNLLIWYITLICIY